MVEQSIKSCMINSLNPITDTGRSCQKMLTPLVKKKSLKLIFFSLLFCSFLFTNHRHNGTMPFKNLNNCLNYTITTLNLIIDITSMLHSLVSLLIKALTLLFIRHYLSKAIQASLIGLNYFCIILSCFY